MPRFDQRCLSCEWVDEVIVKPFENPACPQCGGPTEHVWQTAAKLHRDEIPGGQVIENLSHEPMTFYSKSEIVKEARRRGLEPFVRHVPVPGSDKSPHTTSWDAVSPWQMEQAKQLLERVGRPAAPEPEPTPDVGPVATPELVEAVWDKMSG